MKFKNTSDNESLDTSVHIKVYNVPIRTHVPRSSIHDCNQMVSGYPNQALQRVERLCWKGPQKSVLSFSIHSMKLNTSENSLMFTPLPIIRVIEEVTEKDNINERCDIKKCIFPKKTKKQKQKLNNMNSFLYELLCPQGDPRMNFVWVSIGCMKIEPDFITLLPFLCKSQKDVSESQFVAVVCWRTNETEMKWKKDQVQRDTRFCSEGPHVPDS